jgi:hydrogenase maturation protease
MTNKEHHDVKPILQSLVLDVGNPWRGDDAAGLLAAHALRARGLPGVTIVETNVVVPSLIDSWQGVDRLVVVDAVASGAALGTMHRFDLSRETLPATLSFCSTHAFRTRPGAKNCIVRLTECCYTGAYQAHSSS